MLPGCRKRAPSLTADASLEPNRDDYHILAYKNVYGNQPGLIREANNTGLARGKSKEEQTTRIKVEVGSALTEVQDRGGAIKVPTDTV